jgi:hypothetical protein
MEYEVLIDEVSGAAIEFVSNMYCTGNYSTNRPTPKR